MTYVFDRATALAGLGAGRFVGQITREFDVMAGPNGGYLAAIALRGARGVITEPERAPRSLHVRYLSVPEAGEFELEAKVAREGRALTVVDVALRQGGRACVTASACFSRAFDGAAFCDAAMPDALPLSAATPLRKLVPLNEQFESHVAIGQPEGTRADTGGYIRFADGRPIDVLALAALWDCWPPAIFFRGGAELTGGVPTVEASVYFRRRIETEPERVLVHTHSQFAHDGFIEEDGEIWSLDGSLLAQSRQLAISR